ncbi:coiled-coil domain-containing protein [Proteiniborus ethanoligenes]
MIQVETQKYEKNLSVLEKVLKAYQKNGPGSYVELILSSDSLTTLIERINILGDISKNTSKLLEAIKESKEKLALEKAKLSDKLALIEEQQRKLTEAIENKIRLKNDLEAYLVSLEGEQQKYEEYLSNINKLWSGIKPLFSETVKAFSRMMVEADIPPDAIEIELSLFSIKGVIKEKTFNEIIRSQEFPTKMEFGFSSDRMTVQMPDKRLSLSGTFVVLDGQKLVFEVDKGTFFEMPLESSAIEELFKEGYLELDLKPILGKNIIKSIKINEENIELKITPVLF